MIQFSSKMCTDMVEVAFLYNIQQASNAGQRDHKGLQTEVRTVIVTREAKRGRMLRKLRNVNRTNAAVATYHCRPYINYLF